MNCPTCGRLQAPGTAICTACGAHIAAMGQPMPGIATRTSGLAIAGFVCAFFCSLLGLILSILGLSEINKSNGAVKGKGLAIAGIIISCLSVVLGILAAVAIPAFMDYMKKSKKSEATLQLNKIGKNAKVYYITNSTFPKFDQPLTPSHTCCGQPNNKCQVDPSQWQTPAWQALDFEVDEPGNYRYAFTSNGDSFEAIAVGDLDCDNEEATFKVHVTATDGNPQMTLEQPRAGVY
jgi:Tfp pilus assembly protein PilE